MHPNVHCSTSYNSRDTSLLKDQGECGLRATVPRLLCSPSKNFHLPFVAPLTFAPSTQQVFLQQMISSSLLTCGAPCHSTALAQLNPIPASSQFCMGFALPTRGREAAQGPPVGALLRHFHSDSEAHSYLFTVNSYRCSQQFLGASLSRCLILASPLGFQDKLPRNCLSLFPVLPRPLLSRNHFGLSSGTEQVQDPGFCFSPGQYSSFEVKALKCSSLALDWKQCGVNKHVLI